MTATFTITVEIPDVSEEALNNTALDIQEAVEDDGFSVTQCSPWARPAIGMQPDKANPFT